jgi:hypothetical protein
MSCTVKTCERHTVCSRRAVQACINCHILLIRTDHSLPHRTMSIFKYSHAIKISRLVECDAVSSDKQFATLRMTVVIFESNRSIILDCLTEDDSSLVLRNLSNLLSDDVARRLLTAFKSVILTLFWALIMLARKC